MEGEKILMSQRQVQKLEVMGLVEAGKITLKEGAGKIGMSCRQTKWIRKRVQEKRRKGLISDSRPETSTEQQATILTQRRKGRQVGFQGPGPMASFELSVASRGLGFLPHAAPTAHHSY